MTASYSCSWQPASQAMTEQTARYYEAHTSGQLVAFRHSDGNWYLHALASPAMIPAGGAPLRRRVSPRQSADAS